MKRCENHFFLKSVNFFKTKESLGIAIVFKIFKHFKRIETFFSINLPIL